MRLPTVFRRIVRGFNHLPLWPKTRVRVWRHALRPPTFDRWLYLVLHRLGLMGRADRAFLRDVLRPGMTVVDVGANQGLYTLLFSQQVGPAGRVLAFEPDDRLYRALQDNLSYNHAENVRAFPCAAGSAGGTKTLRRSLINSGDNRLARGGLPDGSWETVEVRVEALDEKLAGERIDFIKMDIQGWEMEALRGMERLIDDPRNGRLAIYFEYWPQGLINAGSDPAEPLSFLVNKGFRLFETIWSGRRAIVDLPAFMDSTNRNGYVNLYALRS